MKVQEFELPKFPGELLAFTLTPAGEWAAFVGKPHPPRETPGLRDTSVDYLVTARSTAQLKFECDYPLLAASPDGTIVVVNSRRWRRDNVWLLDTQGQVKGSFNGGDAVQQVLAAPQGVILTYFDEGALGSVAPSSEGVSLFSIDGQFQAEYASRYGYEPVSIADCYCACLDDAGRLLFSPYTEFPLVRLDLDTWEQGVWTLPRELHYSQALAAAGSTAYFWGSQRRSQRILAFDLKTGRIEDLGPVDWNPNEPLVTLPGGRFVAPHQDRYLVIDPRG